MVQRAGVLRRDPFSEDLNHIMAARWTPPRGHCVDHAHNIITHVHAKPQITID